jgi:chromosome segregation ATPase
MNLLLITVLAGLIGVFLIAALIYQHRQLSAARERLHVEQSKLRNVDLMQMDLHERIGKHEAELELQHVKHGEAIHNLDAMQRAFNDLKFQYDGSQVQVFELEESLANAKAAHAEVQTQYESFQLQHEEKLKTQATEFDALSVQKLQESAKTIENLNQQISALTSQAQKNQLALQAAQTERAQSGQLSGELQFKLDQLEKTLRDVEKRHAEQSALLKQSEDRVQQATAEIAQSQNELAKLRADLAQTQLKHQQAQEAWDKNKGEWGKEKDQQFAAQALELKTLREANQKMLAESAAAVTVHKAQLHDLHQSHQTVLSQAEANSAEFQSQLLALRQTHQDVLAQNEAAMRQHESKMQELVVAHEQALAQASGKASQLMQSLEQSMLEKTKALEELHAQEKARIQNELSQIQRQFHEVNVSRSSFQSQLHAANQQKQEVQAKLLDFEKRWSQLSNEQQQAHDVLMNLKTVVSST